MPLNIKMEKKTLFTFLYVVMIASVIATCIFLVFYLQGNGTACLQDPIQYFSNKTGQMCYCNDGMGWLNPRG